MNAEVDDGNDGVPRQTAMRWPPLVHSTVYQLTAREPVFVKHVVEGNIAYYGLLLQAGGDVRLREYLLGAAVDGLWEFHSGYGVTAADSALVMEGLLECRSDQAPLRHAANQLVARFYSADAGAFQTVLGGRSAYWQGVSVETTAHVAWLLHCIDADAWQVPVARSEQFVRRSQQADGHWQGKWFPSHIIPTWYAMRLLHRVASGPAAENLRRARDYLLRTQQKNGSWSNLVIDTSAAVLALRLADDAGDAIDRAYTWLQARANAGALGGEPVLYYWYDDAGGEKRFYTARDAGQIARAWAIIATRGL